jgi:hypothetical protein
MDASTEPRIDFPPILHARFQRVSIDYIRAQNTKIKYSLNSKMSFQGLEMTVRLEKRRVS